MDAPQKEVFVHSRRTRYMRMPGHIMVCWLR